MKKQVLCLPQSPLKWAVMGSISSSLYLGMFPHDALEVVAGRTVWEPPRLIRLFTSLLQLQRAAKVSMLEGDMAFLNRLEIIHQGLFFSILCDQLYFCRQTFSRQLFFSLPFYAFPSSFTRYLILLPRPRVRQYLSDPSVTPPPDRRRWRTEGTATVIRPRRAPSCWLTWSRHWWPNSSHRPSTSIHSEKGTG